MAWRSRGTTRRGTPADLLVVGLANPGSEYAGSRHNIGGDIVEELADRHGTKLKSEPRQRARLAELVLDGVRVALAVPTTYMNESGAALPSLLARTGVSELTALLVVHDEIDLEVGRLQLKLGGGAAGHNGLRSISSAVGDNGYLRLRVGVGRPPAPQAGASWVLSRPSKADAEILAVARASAVEAIELVASEGIERAMGSVNTRA